MSTNVVGIDYSTTSPCMCFSIDNALYDYDFYYLTNRKKLVGSFDTDKFLISGEPAPDHWDKTRRYKYISDWAMDILSRYDITRVYLEDYAFAATGRVFHIGENTGILKYRLLKREIQYEEVAPTVIKKWAVGKGNASKQDLIEHFNKEHNVNLYDVLGTEQDNPISDIVDSYNICSYGRKIISDSLNLKGAM